MRAIESGSQGPVKKQAIACWQHLASGVCFVFSFPSFLSLDLAELCLLLPRFSQLDFVELCFAASTTDRSQREILSFSLIFNLSGFCGVRGIIFNTQGKRERSPGEK
jgi:hypothetical protein